MLLINQRQKAQGRLSSGKRAAKLLPLYHKSSFFAKGVQKY